MANKVELMILEELDYGMKVLNNFNYIKFGLNGKEECIEVLKGMKEKGFITYKEDTHEIFKGEPCGEILITKMGKRYFEENK